MKVLADSTLYPDKRVLAEALGVENYSLFVKFAEQMETLNLTLEWRYYNDGKEWLCKILNKKKNLGWLSIWENSFRVTVFLTAKTINGFHALTISDEIKTYAKEAKPTGKLIPTITTINTESVIDDMLKILEYKKQLK